MVLVRLEMDQHAVPPWRIACGRSSSSMFIWKVSSMMPTRGWSTASHERQGLLRGVAEIGFEPVERLDREAHVAAMRRVPPPLRSPSTTRFTRSRRCASSIGVGGRPANTSGVPYSGPPTIVAPHAAATSTQRDQVIHAGLRAMPHRPTQGRAATLTRAASSSEQAGVSRGAPAAAGSSSPGSGTSNSQKSMPARLHAREQRKMLRGERPRIAHRDHADRVVIPSLLLRSGRPPGAAARTGTGCVAGSATSVPPAISKPHWIWFSPMNNLQRHRHGAHVAAGQHQREQVFVPRRDEQVDADRDDARQASGSTTSSIACMRVAPSIIAAWSSSGGMPST